MENEQVTIYKRTYFKLLRFIYDCIGETSPGEVVDMLENEIPEFGVAWGKEWADHFYDEKPKLQQSCWCCGEKPGEKQYKWQCFECFSISARVYCPTCRRCPQHCKCQVA